MYLMWRIMLLHKDAFKYCNLFFLVVKWIEPNSFKLKEELNFLCKSESDLLSSIPTYLS